VGVPGGLTASMILTWLAYMRGGCRVKHSINVLQMTVKPEAAAE